MGAITIGIGEWAVSQDPADLIKTFALGSCVAVMIFDTKLRIAGMVHVALPESSLDADKAAKLPGYFADSGVSTLIEELKRRGVQRNHVWVKLAGGASVMDPMGVFDIGKRNILAVKKNLWRSSLGPIAEDTGGNISRTVAMSVADGAVVLSSGSRQWNI